MIGHQEFQNGFARRQHFLGIGYDFHSRLNRPDARGSKHACPSIHNTKAADSDRSLALQVTKGRDVDAVHPRCIEYARAGGHADRLAVNRDVNKAERC